MVRSIAASDHCRWVSRPRWARMSWKVTSICQRRTKMAMIRAGSMSVSVLKKAWGSLRPSGSRTRTHRMALGLVPVRYQGACPERISSVLSFRPPYQPREGDFCPACGGVFETGPQFGQGVSLLPGPAHLARGPRFWRCEQAGVEPQPADEAGVPADGVCEFVGSETAVTDEDDRSFREPAQDHQHALPGPVGERFVAPSHLLGPSLRGGKQGQDRQGP